MGRDFIDVGHDAVSQGVQNYFKDLPDHGGDLAKDTGVNLNSTDSYPGYYTEEDAWRPNPSEPPEPVSNDYSGGEYTNFPDGSEKGEDLNKFSKDAGTEQVDATLENFQEDKWSDLSLEEQKQSMTSLADCVADITGNENPPEIVFRNDMNDGEYGGYNPETNTLEINENMLDDSNEAADTVAHEMWHAYQQQCASDPTSEKGREYQEGFDNYISPEYDFEGYQNQMVEAEARDFAQGFKDRLAEMQGA